MAVCEPVTDMQRRGDFLEYVELLHEVHHLTPTLSVTFAFDRSLCNDQALLEVCGVLASPCMCCQYDSLMQCG